MPSLQLLDYLKTTPIIIPHLIFPRDKHKTFDLNFASRKRDENKAENRMM